MASKLVEYKRRYIINSKVGDATGFIREIKQWYWETKTEYMSEGEILDLYRLLTNK